MSGQRHPDAEALARYRAGLVSGFRGRRVAAHVASCARCASASEQLTGVSRVLASVPAPDMPDAVERQIAAAIAAEAAARQAASPAARRRPRSRKPRLPVLREWGIRPVTAFASAGACLLLAGFGYLLSQSGSSSGPEYESTAAAAAPAAGSAASHAAVSGSAGKAASPTFEGLKPAENQPRTSFLVVASGTDYRQATLGLQVRAELPRNGTASGSSGTPVPAASASAASTGGYAPSQALAGCVLHLTGNVPPSLVDRATYQGKPAYVIAVVDRAWVVGLGCTASDPELVTSIALPAKG